MPKLDAKEKELRDSVDRGEWRSVRGLKSERRRYGRYAAATFRKERRINIRISTADLEMIQKRALEEGLPYQTLISSLLHKYVGGRFAGDPAGPCAESVPRSTGWPRLRLPAARGRYGVPDGDRPPRAPRSARGAPHLLTDRQQT